MVKKSEMAWHFDRLREASTAIALKSRQRPIDLTVFDDCIKAFEHVIPALRYWTAESPDSEPFSVVPYRAIQLLGPAFFAHNPIEDLCEHINSNRYLKKPDFSFNGMLEDIHDRERDAIALWDWIERNPGGEQRFLWQESGVDRATGIAALDLWVDNGIVTRVPFEQTYRLNFASDLSAPIVGMCPSCGATGRARRELLYKHRVCQRCGVDVFYHLVQTTKI